MKILFLTYFYYDIHVPIVEEMIKQGHEVTIIEDRKIRHDFNSRHQNRLINVAKRIIRYFLQSEKRYWDKQFLLNPVLKSFYDILVCQPGYSFCPYLLKQLRLYNPNIKSCVMIHDSSNYYNYYHYKDYYNRVYTFDYEDAKRISGVSVLGAYWVPTVKQDTVYDIVFVGSDHDDRYEIISKVYPQLENKGINSFIRVVSLKPVIRQTKRYSLIDYFCRKKQSELIGEWQEKIKKPYVTENPIAFEAVTGLINKSNCILETEREGQSGITLRDMWALASGKKILTTNTYLKNVPFYNAEQIMFIDRENPSIDLSFIKERKDFPLSSHILAQRIDNWVKRLLEV